MPATSAAYADPELDGILDRIEQLGLVRGLVHGDYYRRNLLWADGRVVALIDWHEARHDLLLAELANAAWQFGKDASGERAIVDRMRSFVEDYERAGGPAEAGRRDLLVPLARNRIRVEARLSLAFTALNVPTDLSYRSVLTAAFSNLRGIDLS